MAFYVNFENKKRAYPKVLPLKKYIIMLFFASITAKIVNIICHILGEK